VTVGRKLSMYIIAVSVSLFLATAYIHYRLEIRSEKKRMATVGATIASLVEESIAAHIRMDDWDGLKKMFLSFHNMQEVKRIVVADGDGYVRVATSGEFVDTRLFNGPMQEGGAFIEGQNLFRWTQPVTMAENCHECGRRGWIVIDFPYSPFGRIIDKHVFLVYLFFLFSFLAIGFSLQFLSGRIVSRRLAAIAGVIDRFRQGDTAARVCLSGDDEISRLGRDFNEMAEDLSLREGQKDRLFRQVLRSKQEWQETFDAITDMIYIHDRGMKIIRANRAFAQYFGLSPREVIGKRLHQLVDDPAMLPPFCVHEVLLEPAVQDVHDARTEKIFRIMTYPCRSDDGGDTGELIHIVRDITEEKGMEMQLILSERLAALGRMASGIAHEINNPLASISGCAEGLLSRVKDNRYDPELFRDYLEIIDEEIHRCKKITTNMLSFVRNSPGEFRKVNINELIEKTLEIIGFQSRMENVEVVKKYSEYVLFVRGDEGELRQVIMIIIVNALDAMEDRGVLMVSTGVKDGNAVVRISDTGPGIAPEHISRIFDPFYTTKRETEGVGLGLAIARKIIMNHNGRIEVHSTENSGTTFTITLPM